MDLHQIILNILIVSIPEATFLIMIILIIMGKTEYITIDNWRKKLVKIMLIAVIPDAIFSNITLLILQNYFNTVVNIIFISICLGILLKEKSIKKISKIMLFTVLGMMILFSMQQITIFVCKFILHTDINYIVGVYPMENFKLTLPERLFEFYILLIAFIKVNGNRNKNLVYHIYKNLKLKIIMTCTYLINLIFFFTMLKSFILDDSLIMVETSKKIVIVTSSISLVILNLAIPWIIAFSIYSSKDKVINFKK